MSAEIDQKAAKLTSTLPLLQSKLLSLGQDQVAKQINTQHNLTVKTDDAVKSMNVFSKLLDGEFKFSSSPAGLKDAIKALESTWKAAEVAAEACLDGASQYSVLITQFHNSGLGDWMAKSKILEATLNATIAGNNEALQMQQVAVQSAADNAAVTQAALMTLQGKLNEQRHKYDEADEYMWIWPLGRLILEVLKPIIEALNHDVENAERACSTAQQTAESSRRVLADQQAKALELAALSQHFAALKQQGEMLYSDCLNLMREVERTQRELGRIKTERYDAWQLAALCANRAENVNYDLTKEDYGTSILQLIEKATADTALRPRLASIVTHLAQHDDAAGSIRKITTDEHPGGLLQYVQQQLQGELEVLQPATMEIHQLISVAVSGAPTLHPADQAKMVALIQSMRLSVR